MAWRRQPEQLKERLWMKKHLFFKLYINSKTDHMYFNIECEIFCFNCTTKEKLLCFSKQIYNAWIWIESTFTYLQKYHKTIKSGKFHAIILFPSPTKSNGKMKAVQLDNTAWLLLSGVPT